MKKLIFIILALLLTNSAYALNDTETLSTNAKVFGVINSSDYSNGNNLSFNKVVFPKSVAGDKSIGVNVDASNITGNLPISGVFWIDSVSISGENESGWVVFNEGGNTSLCKQQFTNLNNGTYRLEACAWSQTSGWVYFGNTGISGGEVLYDRSSGVITGAGWSKNLGWLPLNGLNLITTAPKFDFTSDIFAANSNKNITIVSNADVLDLELENADGTTMKKTIVGDSQKSFSHNFSRASKNSDFIKQVGDYSYKITDEFGNSKSGNLKIVAGVYDSGKSTIEGNYSTYKIANGDDKHRLLVKLRDSYNNPIINETGIKEVVVNLEFNNNLEKNQIDNYGLGDAINFVSNTFNINTYSLSGNSTNSSGDYNIDFSSYTPSNAGYNFSDGNINIDKLNFLVNALGANTGVGEFTKIDRFTSLNNSENFSFIPALKLAEIKNDSGVFLRDVENEFTTVLSKTGSTNVSDLSIINKLDIGSNILMSFQKLTNNGSETISYNGANTSTGYIYSGSCIDCGNNINNTSIISLGKNGNIANGDEVKFKATPKIVFVNTSDLDIKYESIIKYNNNGEEVVHKSIDSTFNTTDVSNNQIKVAGITNSGYDVSIDTDNKVIKTNVNKAELLSNIRKNAYKIINSGNVSNNILYSDGDLSITQMPLGKDTIIVKGGNLSINGNILKEIDGNINTIIVLKENGIGGNIWIDKDTKLISSTIFADGHLISGRYSSKVYYSDSPTGSTDQLFIKGSIVTYNTIGGASNPSGIKCPYPIEDNDCTEKIAKRFDLNHFRHFINTVQGDSFNLSTSQTGKDSIDIIKPGYDTSSMIIEYDTDIQRSVNKIINIK